MRGRFLLLLLSGLTVVLVVLTSCCKCVQWNPVTVTWTGSSPQTWTGNCGDSTGISIYSGTPVFIDSSVQCSSGCNASYTWTVTKIAGVAEVPWTGNSLPASFSPASSGGFRVELNASCDGTRCSPCIIEFDIGILGPAPCSCIQRPSGLIAWWPLDSADMLTPNCEDIAGPYDGYVACGNPEPVAGKVNQACRFSREFSNLGAIRTPAYTDPFQAIGTGNFTIDAWIYPESLGSICGNINFHCDDRPILDNHANNRHSATASPQWQGPGVTFFVRNEGWDGTTGQWASMRLGLAMNTYEFLSTTAPIVLNQWQHVAVSVARTNGNSMGTFYLNGNPIGTTFTPETGDLYQPFIATTTFPNLDIGHASPLNCGSCVYSNDYFGGRLDEIEIFNRALNATEIMQIFEADACGKCKSSCICEGWYPVTANWTGSSPQTWTGNCGDTEGIWIYNGTSVSINSSVQCSCNASYTWTVTKTAGAPEGPWTGNSLPASFSPASWGNFTVELDALCGSTPCEPCIIYLEIDVT